jgi:integrase
MRREVDVSQVRAEDVVRPKKCPGSADTLRGRTQEVSPVPATSSQRPKVGKFVATKTTGIYKRIRADGKTTFYVRYSHPDGKRVWEAAGSFEAAKKRLAEVSGKLLTGTVVGDPATTMSNLIKDWRLTREHGIKPRTRETQEAHVRLYVEPTLGRMKVRDVNRAVVLKWLDGLRRQDGEGPLSDGTRALILATLSSILDHAVLADIVAANPCKALGRKQKPRQGKIEDRVLAADEKDALLAACERFAWLRPIVQTALGSGLRLGEVVGLDWRDVDFEQNVIVVRQNYGKDGRLGTPKGGKVLPVPLVPELRRILVELKLAAKDTSPDAPVFVNKIGGRRRPNEVERAFAKARTYAGLTTEPRAIRFHDLRHTAITTLANQPGAVFTQVQAFARHSNLQTTLGYVHKVEDATWTEQAGAALGGLL